MPVMKDGSVITFRKAEKSDASELLSYLKKIGSQTDYLSFGFEGVGCDVVKEEEIITRFSSAVNSVMIVGVTDGKIVADGTVSAMKQSRFAHNAELGIGVLAEYWDRGIGTALMAELVKYARQNKYIKRLFLTVIAENANAIALYKKFGFVERGRKAGFSKVGNAYLDAVYMDLEV